MLNYKQDVANKKVTLSYSTAARRLLTEINFDEEFTLESFPPAFYSEEDRIQEFENLRKIIYRLSLALIILAAISMLVIRRMHIHVASFFTLPAILTIAFGLASEDYTDWSKWAFKDLLPLSLFGGFKFGDSGDKTNYMEFSDLVWENSGATIVVMAVVWALYGGLIVIGKVLGKGEKLTAVLMWARYFMVTVQLCLAPGMWYSSVYALRSASMTSQGSSINVCISIFISIYLLAFCFQFFHESQDGQ